MNPHDVCRLSAGQFHGHVIRSRELGNFRLTEDAYRRDLFVPRHSHELAYLSFVIQGSYTEYSGNHTRKCTPGTAIFHPASETHSDRFEGAGGHLLSVEIAQSWIDGMAHGGCVTANPKSIKCGAVNMTAWRLLRELREPDSFSSLVIEGLMLQILAEIGRQQTSRSEPAQWMKIVVDILHEEFDQKLDFGLIAKRAGVHPVHLAREFRKQHRHTLGDYVLHIRIQAACQLLCRSKTPISEIAAQTGFFDQSHLARTFKRLQGCTPAQYRRLSRTS
jgi:AraC family transcriptional regulator